MSGLVPALIASRVDLNDVLKQSAARSVVGGMLRLRGTLVVAQIAFSVVLLAGAGPLIKSFVALQTVTLGFRPENVLVARATVPGVALKDSNQDFKDMLDRISHLPGVIAAGATMAPPGRVESDGGYFIDKLPLRLTLQAPSAVRSVVTPGTFAALGIPLVRGRDFDERDSYDAPFTAVVNEALVRTSVPRVDPIGRTIFCPFDLSQGHDHRRGRRRRAATRPGPRADAGVLHALPAASIQRSELEFRGPDRGDPTALTETVRRLARERSAEVPVQISDDGGSALG